MEFAEHTVGRPFMPWQRWLVIHAGELLPDGRPRFRVVHVQVARQNGKTEVPAILSLFWQVVDEFGVDDGLILGTSTKIEYAKESWMKAVRYAERAPGLRGIVPAKRRLWTRQANGEQESTLCDTRYKIAAANEEGGRSLTLARAILDELRQHHDYSAWDAVVPAMNAQPYAQCWTLSNAGTDRSVVLNDERRAAQAYIDTGVGDRRTGWFEWSCEPDADPLDLDALAQANPGLGITIEAETLLSQAVKAVEVGGEKLAGFRTECMCIGVQSLAGAVNPEDWAACAEVVDLGELRDRLALCIDVAPDAAHATAVVAAVDGDRVRVEVVGAWTGPTSVRELVAELPALLRRVRPRVLGWFPDGPAAAAADELTPRRAQAGGRVEPVKRLHGARLEPIRADTATACVAFAEVVQAHTLGHPADPLLSAHVLGADRARRGDRWVFDRRGGGHCDAAYAAAGAVHLVRTLPKSLGRVRIVTARTDESGD